MFEIARESSIANFSLSDKKSLSVFWCMSEKQQQTSPLALVNLTVCQQVPATG